MIVQRICIPTDIKTLNGFSRSVNKSVYNRSAPERLERFTWGRDDRKLTNSLLSAAMHLFPSDNLKCIKDKPD